MDATQVKAICDAGRQAATEKPGRYGGRYVARISEKVNGQWRERYEVLPDDDPALCDSPAWRKWDVFAQCTPDTVHPIGPARRWLNSDGTLRPL